MSEIEILPHLEFGAENNEADLTVILMHGLGASGHDFEDVAMYLADAAKPAQWRFVLPHAPVQPVTINMGMEMPAWYDILDMSHPRMVNWDTVDASLAHIEAMIKNESASKIVLAGFSQGGAMALHVGLRNQESIVGILAMSGYLLEDDGHPCPGKETDLPIGIFHGEMDDVVPAIAARQSIKTLESKKYEPSSKFYPGLPHSVSMDEIEDVFSWLKKV